MPKTKEIALRTIKGLVQRFEEQLESYKNKDYNETPTRRDFIDPFWEALGWDVANKSNSAESYREVIHEDRVKVGGVTKAPDYSFRLPGGKRMFFLEAKKPSVYIKDDAESAAQVRRYGWSAGLSVSILTNFDYFAVYDCTVKPKQTDKSSVARIKQLTYSEYISEFDFIWDTFSRERVQQGGLDKYVQNDSNKKGTSTVDKDFLETLDKWRIELAKNISAHNSINEDELNYVVQNTIDRLIFLRIAEDRHLEQYGQLQDAIKNGVFYKNILNVFKTADQKYNSSLFDFKKDRTSENVDIDNKTIKSIISELYPPSCPYEFSVMAVEILGSAYEQFLGKQILLSKSGRAVIEEKPEVRKAGGVYYTPQYIVDYIVKNTVGKLLEDMTPVEASAVKIVDPACGSGSFLLGAYQYLLNWHKDFYNLNEKQNRGKKDSPLTPSGELTTAAKKRILTNSIYGVDLDANAAEVTKLSLLLKCLEGETKESIEAQSQLFHDRILPDLDGNIKSGNSLIDLDYYDNEMDFSEERKIKPFSWQKAFPEVFKQGGFDCVIGNPPYVKERGSKEIFEPILSSNLGKLYHQGKMDFWYYFLHKGIDILKPDGFLSFITNSYWMKSDGASKMITRINNEMTVYEIVYFDDYKVFADVSGKHNISFFIKGKYPERLCTIRTINNENPTTEIENYKGLEIHNSILIKNNKLNIQSDIDLFDNCELLDEHFEVSQGVVEATDKITKKLKENSKNRNINIGDGVFVLTKEEINRLGFNNDEIKLLKPYVNTNHVNRYSLHFNDEYLLYLGKYERENIAKKKYPNIKKHLDSVKEFITSSNAPYGIHRPREYRFFDEPKLICKGMFDRPAFYYDEEKYYCGFSFSIIIQKSKKYELKLLLALMNSKLGEYWFNSAGKKRGIGVDIGVKVFREFPLPLIGETKKQQHEKIIKHVDQLLQLNKDLQTATLPNQKEQFNAKIGYHEDQVNILVYELYGLTDEEIRVIERK